MLYKEAKKTFGRKVFIHLFLHIDYISKRKVMKLYCGCKLY